MHRPFIAIFLLGGLALHVATAQEKAADGKSPASVATEPKIFLPEEADPNWLEFYYQKPRPEEFVQQMEALSADGTLANDGAKPVVIAFLSQMFRQNRDQIEGWYSELRKKLLPEDIQTIQTGMLFSRTKESDEILEKQFGAQYAEQKRKVPKVLELRLDQAETIDMLWGFYYASGSESAIRRLIMGFRFLEMTENPENVEIPEEHIPVYRMIPVFVGDSLIANAIRHPKIPEILKKLHDEGDLNEIERREVGRVLEAISEAGAAASQ